MRGYIEVEQVTEKGESEIEEGEVGCKHSKNRYNYITVTFLHHCLTA